MVSIIDKIINQSDIIIEVVDARAIDFTRNKRLEEKIKKKGKFLFIVAMKSDKVDEKKLKEKLSKLELPTVYASFKEKKGYREVRKLINIGSYKIKKEKNKDKIFVGIIGYTNAGKSSLINLITFSSKTKASSLPGFTKKYQWIKLKKDIMLIDTAGVIEAKNPKDLHVLKGNVNPEKTDCYDHALELLRYAKKYENNFEKVLGVKIDDEEKAIEEYAIKRKFMLKDGKPDVERAAKEIIRKWNSAELSMFVDS